MYALLIALALFARKAAAAASLRADKNDEATASATGVRIGTDAEQPDRRSDQVLKFTKFTDDI